MSAELVIGLAALLILGGATLLFGAGRRETRRQRMLERLQVRHEGSEAAAGSPRRDRFERWLGELLGRAGLEPARWQALLFLVLVVVLGAAGTVVAGSSGLAGGVAVALGLAWAALAALAARYRRRLSDQLPPFLDHVIRAVRAGHSVEQAITAAVEESEPPIRAVFRGVVRQLQLGVALDEALAQTAATHRLQELDLVEMAVRVNLRYGGGIREILESVIGMVRQREHAERELRAMTGETRLSAGILAALPVAIGGYIVASNPAYFQEMLQDAGGRALMLFGLGLQVAGVVVLWRMVRSMSV